MTDAPLAKPSTPAIYALSIQRFRGISALDWRPARGVNVILDRLLSDRGHPSDRADAGLSEISSGPSDGRPLTAVACCDRGRRRPAALCRRLSVGAWRS